VSDTTDYYCSNRLPLLSLPSAINVIRLNNAFPDDFDLTLAPHPISPHKRFLLSFATTRDLLPLIEGHRLGLDSYGPRETAQFIEKGEGKFLDAKSARNHVRFLVRQGFERLALARGLIGYNLSGRRRFFWFPSDLVPDNKAHFPALDGSNAWRRVVGYRSIKARDGKVRIRNWHFGIEGVPRTGFENYVALLPHVVFSEGGVVYTSTKKQHSCRRSQCKSWYNDDWRDRIIATLHYFADGESQLQVPLGSEAFSIIEARLQMIESPVTYVKTLPSKSNFANETEELIGDEREEELEDDDDE
jgi:hypothetical protein